MSNRGKKRQPNAAGERSAHSGRRGEVRTSVKPEAAKGQPRSGGKLAQQIGQRIVRAREGLGWSQQALHTRTKWSDPDGKGISRGVLSLYETGVNKPGAREILILCEALKVTPNWLLYGEESPARAMQASLEFLRGDELTLSVRLAYAMLALEPVERNSFASILFALIAKKLGDVKLSALMMMANMQAAPLLKEIVETVGEDAKKKSLVELLDVFVAKNADGLYTNYGNLRPAVPEDQLEDFDPEHPPPIRKL